MKWSISVVDNTNRKYEFSFLSREKGVAVSYSHDRINLSNEKFDILQANSEGIQLIYIVDIINSGVNGQYPESLMRIQDRQGYCLLLDIKDVSYNDAKMYAVFYAQDSDGLWQELKIVYGLLSEYAIADNGQLTYKNELLSNLLKARKLAFKEFVQEEKIRREKEVKRRVEQQERRKLVFQKQQEKAERELKRQQEETELWRKKKETERQEDFSKNMQENFSQQETQVRDADGNRWIKCEYCGLIAKESEFVSYGGLNHVNLGTCKSCSLKPLSERVSVVATPKTRIKPMQVKYDATTCPECGGVLRERNGKYGSFIGCSNYPDCRYTRKIGK